MIVTLFKLRAQKNASRPLVPAPVMTANTGLLANPIFVN
jgi:hypothetical protein